MRIITVANLIENEIRCIQHETVYPSRSDIELGAEFLPPTLKLLIKVLVGQGSKQASLGQSILKAMKSKCYTSFIIWVKSRNRSRYCTLF